MPRKRNGGRVYTGTVKDAAKKLPNKTDCTRQTPVKKDKVRLRGGPWDGRCVALTEQGGYSTLPMCIGDHAGRYVGGNWESIKKEKT